MRCVRGFLAVAAMSFRVWWRDRSSAFWGVVFPLLLMGLLGSAFGRTDTMQFTMALVTPSAAEGSGSAREGPAGSGPAREWLRQALRSVSVVKLVEEPKEAALAALRKGDRTLVLEVGPPQQPGALAHVHAYYRVTQDQTAQAAIAVVRHALHQVGQYVTGTVDLFELRAESVAAKEFRMFDFLLPGVLAMSIMQTGLMGVSWSVADYRERRVLKRVLATPFHPLGFLSGLLARFTLVALLQSLLILAVGVWGFHARVEGSIPVLMGLAALGSVAFLAMGLAISTLAPTAESANLIGSVLNFPMMFLSGTFWPKELMPDFMQPVVRALPLTPLIDSMRAVSTEAAAVGPYAGGLLYLAAWGVAALVVASLRFRWE